MWYGEEVCACSCACVYTHMSMHTIDSPYLAVLDLQTKHIIIITTGVDRMDI